MPYRLISLQTKSLPIKYSRDFIVLKNKTIHSIFVKGENGFPLQATCFPVGERRAASSVQGLACLAMNCTKNIGLKNLI